MLCVCYYNLHCTNYYATNDFFLKLLFRLFYCNNIILVEKINLLNLIPKIERKKTNKSITPSM